MPLVASNKVVASPPPSYTAVDVSAPADSIQGVLKQLFPNEDCGEVVTTLDENMYDSLASLAEDQEWHTLTTIPANILQALIGYIEKI